jgi:hypothetical protein
VTCGHAEPAAFVVFRGALMALGAAVIALPAMLALISQ